MDTKFLKENPLFWSRLGFGYDPPMKDSEGKPLIFAKDFSAYEKFHRDFKKQGINIHTSILHSGWVGVNEYDYCMTDKTLDSIFSVSDEIFYLPRIKLNVPIDWCKENPEYVFLYEEASRNPNEISALAGTLKHDILGYESKNGYFASDTSGTFVDKRPNINGLIGLQSISSPKWLSDAGTALKNLINHIEKGCYADRIIGYHICFGPCGENMYWGRASGRYGDYGIECLRQFYDYGLSKYKDKKLLSEKWQQQDISRNTIKLSTAFERYNKTGTLEELFRGDRKDIICCDYDEFLSESVADAIEYFGKIVKECTDNKLVGSFYGYFAYVANAQYAGHLAMDRLLGSKYVDFFAAPFTYSREKAGEPSGSLTAVQSVNLKKLWVEEIDCRTHLASSAYQEGITESDSIVVLWREFLRNISRDSGYWWMDLGGGWFDSPALMETIGEITKLSEKLQKTFHKSISDVLVVVDEKSLYKMGVCGELCSAFLVDFLAEVNMSGAIADLYRYADLPELDLTQYKIIIFAYDFCVPKNFIETLNIPKDVTLMFNYAFGIWDDAFSIDNVSEKTGFKVIEYPDENYEFPMLKTADNQFVSERVLNGRHHILNLKPYMQSDELRQLFASAGVNIYAPKECSVFGDNRIIGVFSRSAVKGIVNLHENGHYREAISGKMYDGGCFEVDMPPKSAMLFIKEAEK